MKNSNHFHINGHLTKDATLKSFDNGSGIIQFSIAVNTSKKEGDKWVDVGHFFNCKHRGKNLEKLTAALTKGKYISCDGALTQDRWQGADGKQNSAVILAVEELEFLGGGNSSNSGYSAAPSEIYSDGDFQDVQEDIPF